MFGIGMPEMLLILAVALIVIGPKKLPELAKSLGRALGEFKRATTDLKDSIEAETQIGEVKNAFKDLNKDIKSSLDSPKPDHDIPPSTTTVNSSPETPMETDSAAPAPEPDAPDAAITSRPDSTQTQSAEAEEGDNASRKEGAEHA